MIGLFGSGWTNIPSGGGGDDDLAKAAILIPIGLVGLGSFIAYKKGSDLYESLTPKVSEIVETITNVAITAGTVSGSSVVALGAAYGLTKILQVKNSAKNMVALRVRPSENHETNHDQIISMIQGFAQPNWSGLKRLHRGRIWFRWQIIKDGNGRISFYCICPKDIVPTVTNLLKLGFTKAIVEEDKNYQGLPGFYDPVIGDMGHMTWVTPKEKALGLKGELTNSIGNILFQMPNESMIEVRFSSKNIAALRKQNRKQIKKLKKRESDTEDHYKIKVLSQRYMNRNAFDVNVFLYSNRALKRLANAITQGTKGLNSLTLKQYRILEEYRDPYRFNIVTPLFNRRMLWNDIELANLFSMPDPAHPVMEKIEVALDKLIPKANELSKGIKLGIVDHDDYIKRNDDASIDWEKSRAIRVTPEVFTVHPIISGKSGSGKGAVLVSMMDDLLERWVDDPENAIGFTLNDPHGLTIYLIINRLLELERKGKHVPWEKVHAFHVGNEQYPMPLNLLYKDQDFKLDDMVEETAQIILQAFESSNLSSSKIVLENGLHALLCDPSETYKISDFSKVFQKDARKKQFPFLLKKVWKHIKNDYVRDWFQQEVIDPDKPKNISAVMTRLAPFLNRANMQAMYSHEKNAFADTKTIFDEGHLVLISYQDLPEGHPAYKLTAGWIANRYHNEMKKRNPDDNNRVHLLIFDEAQMFHVSRFIEIVAQDRKFGFGLMIATQDIDKLHPELRNALTINSGMMISLNQAKGAKIMAELMRNKFTPHHLSNLEKMHAAVWSDEGSANMLVPPPAFRYNGKIVPWLDENERVTEAHKTVAKEAREKFIELVKRSSERYSIQDKRERIVLNYISRTNSS